MGAADQHCQRGGKKRDEPENAREGEVLRHADVMRQGENHRVHREGGAESELRAELAHLAAGGAGFLRREGVAEGSELVREGCQIRFPGKPAQPQQPGRRMGGGFERTVMAAVNILHQPDAAHARQPLQREITLGLFTLRDAFLDGGRPLLQPREISRLERHAADGAQGGITTEIVEVPEAFALDHPVHELAAAAAEFFHRRGGGEGGGAMFADGHGRNDSTANAP